MARVIRRRAKPGEACFGGGSGTLIAFNVPAAPVRPARCRPGDLAIIIAATYPCNIGKIVHVLRRDGVDEPAWWRIESTTEIKWRGRDGIYFSKEGPAPDWKLRSIRGDGTARNEKSVVEDKQKVTA